MINAFVTNRILDYVPRVLDCLYINKLWLQAVLEHTDYKTLWGIHIRPNCTTIICHGSPKMLALYNTNTIESILYEAIIYNKPAFIKHIIDNYNLSDKLKTETHELLCEHGHITIAKQLHLHAKSTYLYWPDHVIESPEFINVLKYIRQIPYKIDDLDNLIFILCRTGNIEAIKYLQEIYGEHRINDLLINDDTIDAIILSCNNELYDMLIELNVDFEIDLEQRLLEMVANNNTRALKNLYMLSNSDCEVDNYYLLKLATQYDYIDIIKWYHKKNAISYDDFHNLTYEACRHNSLKSLMFYMNIYINNKEFFRVDPYKCIRIAITRAHIDVVKYLFSEIHIPNKYIIQVNDINHPLINSICDVIKYLKHYLNTDIMFTYEAVDAIPFTIRIVCKCKYIIEKAFTNLAKIDEFKYLYELASVPEEVRQLYLVEAIVADRSDILYYLIAKSL